MDALSTVAGKNYLAKEAILRSIVRGAVFVGDKTIINNSEVEYSIILNKRKIENLNARFETSLLEQQSQSN